MDNQKIGPLQFLELPQSYQDQFNSGAINTASRFYPFVPSDTSLPMAIFLTLVYIFPVLFFLFYGIPYLVTQNPDLIGRIFTDWVSGVAPFIVTTIILGIIFGGLFWMLWMGWLSLKNLSVWLRTRKPRPTGVGVYGIIFDEENMVIRTGDYFADYSCAFLPKEAIDQSFTSTLRIRHETQKQPTFIDVVKIRYRTIEGLMDELILKEEFSLAADELQQVISNWRQV